MTVSQHVKSVLLLAGSALAASCAQQVAQPDMLDGYKQTYEERLQIYMTNPADYPYDPMEPVEGTDGFQPLPQASDPEIDDEAIEKAKEYAVGSQAAAYIAWHKGKVISSYYGNGIDASTPLVSKSLSKPLGSIVVGRAIELGYIDSLDQELGTIIKELEGKPKGKIKVRHLLDMRSGLLDQGFNNDPESPWNLAYLSLDHGTYIAEEYPMIDQPGTRYAYSNATGDFVALVVERASGRRWSEFLGNEILKPIGAAGGEIWVSKPGGLAHSGCCMYMPAESYLRLGILLAQDGTWDGRRLLPEGYVTEMGKGTEQNPNYGLGLWLGQPYQEYRGFGAPGAPGPKILQSEPFLAEDTVMFDGNNNQTVHISAKEQLVVLRMGPFPPQDFVWDNSYLPNALMRGLK